MERSKRDLESLVSSQKEQLSRYEKRLKDVVTAYKGLIKEKEALETSLKALTVSKESANNGTESNETKDGPNENMQTNLEIASVEDKNHMEIQTLTLMNSLATLSAEKSRMEASFQADKKQLRQQLLHKDERIYELQQQQKERNELAKMEVEKMRAKWIIEREERDKETNNQILMIRELQKLYADERHLKENIEMQLDNFKTQFASKEAEHSRLNELQHRLKEANEKVHQLQNSDKQLAINADNTLLLQQLQQEIKQLKKQHAVALKNEQRRVMLAEDQSREQAAAHEERVTNLEARLAELSTSVGKYDRLRQQDQLNIQALKNQLQDLERDAQQVDFVDQEHVDKLQQHDIVEQILRLKKLLLQDNAHTNQTAEMNKIFAINTNHIQCTQELANLQQQNDMAKMHISEQEELLAAQKSHISTLQEKVKVLNLNIEEQETEIQRQNSSRQQGVQEERAKWQQILNEKENESRSKLNNMEQQLQKQRQRSLQLLEDKDLEIKALQNSFEILHNGQMSANSKENHFSASSDNESNDELVIPSVSYRSTPMLHYANEQARKDKELSMLRKAKFTADSSLRVAIQEKVLVQQELNERIAELEEQVDRFQRCVNREGANLEYLKNVIISFIVTNDTEGKRHMLNAISAVLQFTNAETQAINAVFHKK